MLLQQIIGIINLSIPAIVLYQLFPSYILHPYGIALYSLCIGLYILYCQYRAATNIKKALLYTPKETVLESFNKEIIACGMLPEQINLRYSYLNDNVASSTLNTICIDPMIWKDIDHDSDVIIIKNIIERQIIPNVPEASKKMHAHIAQIISPAAQHFIFRHELGHTYYAYTPYVLCALFFIGVIMAALGMMTAYYLLPVYGGLIALIAGMLVSGISDLLLGYCNNAFLKVTLEKQADSFAIKHSTAEELNAAADFFEQYEEAAIKYRTQIGGLQSILPAIAVTGHPNAKIRVAYLRNAAALKS